MCGKERIFGLPCLHGDSDSWGNIPCRRSKHGPKGKTGARGWGMEKRQWGEGKWICRFLDDVPISVEREDD